MTGGIVLGRAILPAMLGELQALADPAFREQMGQQYATNVDDALGVRMPQIHALADQYYPQLKTLPIGERVAACEILLDQNIYELRAACFRWMQRSRTAMTASLWPVFEGWLERHVSDWADCDDLCTHVIGELLVRFPDLAFRCLDWTESTNRWKRRGAAVSLITPARKGAHLQLAFQVADRLIGDSDDLVQKGYGWLLKVVSKPHPQPVFDYLLARKQSMPRLALRYACEKLPPAMQAEILRKE